MKQLYILTLFGFLVAVSMLHTEVPTMLYDGTQQTMLQLFNGEGFLSQGGVARIDLMVGNTTLKNKQVLDFGSGLGAPAFHLVEKYNAFVTGVDIDPALVEKATTCMYAKALSDRLSFQTVATQPLPFSDSRFDVIFSKESIVHIQNKQQLFNEFYRLLKPGGTLIILDWFRHDQPPSEDLQAYLQFNSYEMYYSTIKNYVDLLGQAKFVDVNICSTTHLHLADTQQEYVSMQGNTGQLLVERLGSQMLHGCLIDWQRLIRLFESSEVETYLVFAKKP